MVVCGGFTSAMVRQLFVNTGEEKVDPAEEVLPLSCDFDCPVAPQRG